MIVGAPVEVALLDSDARIAPWIEAAARLIEVAFPRPAMETNAALLAWHLTKVEFDSVRSLAVVAIMDGRLVGFAGATPRPIECGGQHGIAYVVSFVSVDPAVRGRGIAAQLYDRLLSAVPSACRVLTFAIEGSTGMSVLEHAYVRNGFASQSLGVLPPYAVFRQRIGSGTAASTQAVEPSVALNDDPALNFHLDADPRGSKRVGNGHARAVAAWRLTEGDREPLLLVEDLRAPLDSDELRATVSQAFTDFPEHGKLLVVPNFPVGAASVAQAVGLRRLAGPMYRSWICSRDATDPLLRARTTSHPIL